MDVRGIGNVAQGRPSAAEGGRTVETLPGETAPTRFAAPFSWRLSNILAVERNHAAFHRLMARRKGARNVSSHIEVKRSPDGGKPEAAEISTRFTVPPEEGGGRPSVVFIREYAAFVGLRNILLGAGWSRVVQTPSPFMSTAGGGLGAVLGARAAAERLSNPAGTALGPFDLAARFLWVRHPESKLWRDIKTSLRDLSLTVSSVLSDSSAWEDERSALSSVRRVMERFNAAVRVLNKAVSSVKGALPGDPLLQGAEASMVEAVRGPVYALPPELDEAEEAGITFDMRGVTGLSRMQLEAAARGGADWIGRRRLAEAVGKIGVTLADDFTLRLDEEKFLRVFRGEPDTVRALLAGEPSPGGYPDGLPVFRRLERVLGTLLDPSGGSFAMAELKAQRLCESRPWEAYLEASAELREQTISLLV